MPQPLAWPYLRYWWHLYVEREGRFLPDEKYELHFSVWRNDTKRIFPSFLKIILGAKARFTLIPASISNHLPSSVWRKYLSIPNFNGSNVALCKKLSMLGLKLLINVSKSDVKGCVGGFAVVHPLSPWAERPFRLVSGPALRLGSTQCPPEWSRKISRQKPWGPLQYSILCLILTWDRANFRGYKIYVDFDRSDIWRAPGSRAAETPIEFQSDSIISDLRNFNDILWQDKLSNIETCPLFHPVNIS